MAKVGVVLTNDTKQRVRRVDPKLAGYLIGKGKARLADAVGAVLGAAVGKLAGAMADDDQEDWVTVTIDPLDPKHSTEADDLVNKSYRDLMQMAREAGVTPEGRTKEDYIRALRARDPIPRPDE